MQEKIKIENGITCNAHPVSLRGWLGCAQKPYYEDESVVLYHADNRDVLPLIKCAAWDLIHTDPPYGIDLDTNYANKGSGGLCYAAVQGDGFGDLDLKWLTEFDCTTVLWGAHSYYWFLPIMKNPGWICWDKRVIENADKMRGAPFELAWINKPKYFEMIRLQHGGVVNADGWGETRLHPTQKPIKLAERIILKHTKEGGIVGDFFAGSGSTLIAAKRLRRLAIGIEIEERYCEITAKRLSQNEMVFT